MGHWAYILITKNLEVERIVASNRYFTAQILQWSLFIVHFPFPFSAPSLSFTFPHLSLHFFALSIYNQDQRGVCSAMAMATKFFAFLLFALIAISMLQTMVRMCVFVCVFPACFLHFIYDSLNYSYFLIHWFVLIFSGWGIIRVSLGQGEFAYCILMSYYWFLQFLSLFKQSSKCWCKFIYFFVCLHFRMDMAPTVWRSPVSLSSFLYIIHLCAPTNNYICTMFHHK